MRKNPNDIKNKYQNYSITQSPCQILSSSCYYINIKTKCQFGRLPWIQTTKLTLPRDVGQERTKKSQENQIHWNLGHIASSTHPGLALALNVSQDFQLASSDLTWGPLNPGLHVNTSPITLVLATRAHSCGPLFPITKKVHHYKA